LLKRTRTSKSIKAARVSSLGSSGNWFASCASIAPLGERAGVRGNNHLLLNRFISDLQPDDLFEGQHPANAGRRAGQSPSLATDHDARRAHRNLGHPFCGGLGEAKPVKVRAADRRKEQRVMLGGNDSFQSRINRHGFLSQLSTNNHQLIHRLRRNPAVRDSGGGGQWS